MAGYAARVTKDIARWRDRGLIDAATADALAGDVMAQDRSSFSFGTILAIMAAILLGAAVLLFVAANWEAIPRLLRVGLLFAIIGAAYVGGAILKARRHDAFAEASWLVGVAAFGGAIAAVGQMYHLSGDEAQAVLTWCAGATLAALALRSSVLTAAAVALADAWLFMRGFEFWDGNGFPHAFLALAAVLWLVSYWTHSRIARHLVLLSLVFYLVLVAVHHDSILVAAALAAGSAALLLGAVFAPAALDRLAMFDGRLPIHGLIGFLAGMAVIQGELVDDSAPLIVSAAIVFGGIAAALVLAGRDSRGLRWIAYTGFAVEICFVYGVLLGTMLGTAGFFLAAAVILGLLAFVIIGIERRMKAAPAGEGAVS